jgi:Lon protease-like protein
VQGAPRHPVPLFPLPQLVLFPGAMAPVHVFELRYRTLVRDTLSRDRVIALGLLKPGYEFDYHGSPEVHELGCLARFEDVEWLPNDRYNLMLVGVSRVRFQSVLTEFPYRSVRVEMLPQDPFAEDDPLIGIEKRAAIELLDRLRDLAVEAQAPGSEHIPALDAETPYETAVNTLCMIGGGSPEERLALLAENSVIERGRKVRAIVEKSLSPEQRARTSETGERN